MITKRSVDEDGDGDSCDEVMRLLAEGVRSNLCSSHAFSLSEF